jgi:hypothetical protein
MLTNLRIRHAQAVVVDQINVARILERFQQKAGEPESGCLAVHGVV